MSSSNKLKKIDLIPIKFEEETADDKNYYGKVHAIYGRGKGKTTAAIGLTVRTAGYGLKTSFVQFMKNGESNERRILDQIPEIDYYCPGNHGWASIRQGLVESQKYHALLCLEYALNVPEDTNMLVCDEILNVPLFGAKGDTAFTYEDIGELIKSKRSDLELVITGLQCPNELIELVDYASQIKKVAHPFQKGLIARPGIEY